MSANQPKHTPITSEAILDHLKKEGVTDLKGFADYLVKKGRGSGDPNGPVVNDIFIYKHGVGQH